MNNAPAWWPPVCTTGTSAMMMAMAPVACTAMKAELVNSDPPNVPNR